MANGKMTPIGTQMPSGSADECVSERAKHRAGGLKATLRPVDQFTRRSTPSPTTTAEGTRTSPIEHASRAARAAGAAHAYRTFASSGLTSAATPTRRGRERDAPTSTPMSASVKMLVSEAMTSLKKARSRVEDLVRSHRGVGLNFDDVAPASPTMNVAASPSTSETTAVREDREAEREATEMLIRSAKKSIAKKSAPVSRSPMRSPLPLRMERFDPSAPVVVLADSKATESTMVQGNGERANGDGGYDDEVTSQLSLPPGFDASEFLEDVARDEHVVEPSETDVEKTDEENSDNNIDKVMDQLDVFAKMMAKVVANTLDEISANIASKPVTIPSPKANRVPTSPRRSSRRRSVAGEPVTTPSLRSSHSAAPTTPSRRSKRLASKGKERT
ncbi:hypothetical protein BE221DRAFT_68623 [Ostreococcus tauri]|uniref:Uncharacterized protein n=1 Tax=Ostreococcus tauri TaxID=70448 RepID=A0A1Y5IFP2_OSTTA|nr:hypothetical protein BE221DRAFT_68623 [Ostreococcus tauri]